KRSQSLSPPVRSSASIAPASSCPTPPLATAHGAGIVRSCPASLPALPGSVFVPLYRHLLSVDHAIALLFSPTTVLPLPVLSVTFPHDVPHLLFHDSHHQQQSRLPHQVTHTFLQHPNDVGHRQDRLDSGIYLAGELVKLLYGTLTLD